MRIHHAVSLAAAAIAAIAVGVGVAAYPAPASAQDDDWDVRRDPFDRRVVATYKRILARNPSDRGALRKLVQLYRKHRSVGQLVREYEAQVAKDPRDFAGLLVLGHIHLGQNAADQALASYEKAAAVRPGDAAVQLALGDLYRQGDQPAKARAAYEVALSRSKSRKAKMTILRSLAELALRTDDIDGARGYYEQYIALDPKNAQTRIELGDALSQHGKHDLAIEAYKKAEDALRSDPARQVEVIARIGNAYEAAGDEDAAVREYRRAMAKVGRGYYLQRELTARIVEIYRRRQALPELLRHYEQKWPAARRGHFEWDQLARLYEETGSQERAIEAYKKAAAKAPHELDTQRRLISLLENAGREDEALAQYEAVIRVAPGEPRFQLELAQRYWDQRKEKQALAMLGRMERRFPSDAGVHAAIAELYTRWGKPDLALKAYVRLTQIEPGDVSHLVNLGEQYFQRGNKKQAVGVWKRIVASKTADSYARLGQVYAEHDMLTDALAMFEEAIKRDRKNAEHYKGRAGVHERRRRYAEAIADWNEVLKLTADKASTKPERREARRRIVGLLKRSRGNELAREMRRWERAFARTPPDVEAGYFLVEAHMRDHKYGRARDVLERLLEIDPKDADAMEELVKVYKRERKYDQAVALLLKLAEQSPGREREYYTRIAEIKTFDRKDDEAIHYMRKALEKSPTDPLAHLRLAESYESMLQFDKAIEAYEKTIELDRRNFKAHFVLAKLYNQQGKHRAEANLYRAVLQRATEDELLRKAGAKAIELEDITQSLGGLERVLAPLSFTFSHKPIYRRILVQLYDRYVDHLVRRTQAGTGEERAGARAELARIGQHGLKPLLEALSDAKDVEQQRIAVRVLGYLGNKGAAAPLVKIAREAAQEAGPRRRIGTLVPTLDWDVRVSALVGAGRLGDARIIPALVELAGHRENAMREAAVFALGRTRSPKAAPALVAALDDGRASVQALACLGLAQLGAAAPLDRLIAAVGDDRRDDDARAACAFALGYLGNARAVDALIGVLSQGNEEAQRLAAWALGQLGDRKATPTLLAAYFSRHAGVREAVAWALGRLSRPGRGAGKPPDHDFGAFPTRLGKFHTEAAVRALPGPLGDTAPPADIVLGYEKELAEGLSQALRRHRDLVVRVLEHLDGAGDRLALGPLTAQLAAEPAATRARIRAALDRVGAAIFPDLEALASHRDTKVRQLALSVISKIDAARTEDILLAGIRDEAASVRIAAMRAAARYVSATGKGAQAIVGAVVGRLDGDSWQVQREAATVLGEVGARADAPAAVSALIRALGTGNGFVRERAALALGALDAKAGRGDAARAAVPALLEATRDDLAEVRLAAARALVEIGDPRARRRLEQLAASDDDPRVREAAGRRP